MTKSANDAAVVVAEAIGGTESEFAEMMTKKARAIGMSHTVYRNASGLPNDDQVTTARDQALLGRAIQERFPRQYRYFSTLSFTYHGESMRNHNMLLGHVDGVDGIKTGYTQASGFNLVTSVHRNNRHIVAVVLGGASAGARDAKMRSLIETHIAAASTQHTATAIAEAAGAKIETRTATPKAADAKAEARQAKAPSTYSVASFSPPAAWPASKFVPVAPAENALTTVPPAPATAAVPVNDAVKAPQPARPAASVEGNDTIKPIQVKTIKVKLTQTQTAGLGPIAAPVREEHADGAAEAAPVAAPKAPTPAPKPVAIAPSVAAPIAAAAPVAPAPLTAPAAAAPAVAPPAPAPVAAASVAPATAAASKGVAIAPAPAPVAAPQVAAAAAPVAPAPVAVPKTVAIAPTPAPVAAPQVGAVAAPVAPAPVAVPKTVAIAPAPAPVAAPQVAAVAAPVAPAPVAVPKTVAIAPVPAVAPVVTPPVAAVAAPVAPAVALPKTAPPSVAPAAAMASATVVAATAAPEAIAPEAKRDAAAHSVATHTGWIVQVGAFDVERDAQQRLSTAHAKIGHVLDNADPFTEPVVKGDKTLYRARFAGFQQKDEADAVCKQLKRNDIDCMTIKN